MATATNQALADSVVRFDRVSKWYGPVIGLNEVSFTLMPGIVGLVGPNGAGKSTLIRLVTGQLKPTIGRVTVCDQNAWSPAAKNHIGYCPDADAFYEEMSGREFVHAMARLRGYTKREAIARTDWVLQTVGMAERAQRRIGGYSKGMRQRIKLAQALIHDPDMVVLDEPLNGVDPVGRRELVDVFQQLASRGKVVLVSSHILDELDKLATRILFIYRGRMLASGSLDQIREMLQDYPMLIRVSSNRVRDLGTALFRLDTVLSAEVSSDNELMLRVQHPERFQIQFAAVVAKADFAVTRFQVADASSEAVFDYLTEQARMP